MTTTAEPQIVRTAPPGMTLPGVRIVGFAGQNRHMRVGVHVQIRSGIRHAGCISGTESAGSRKERPSDLIRTVRRVIIDALGTNTMSGFLSDARTFQEAV